MGLSFLAKARSLLPDIHALMMTTEVFNKHCHRAVDEPVIAGPTPLQRLTLAEKLLYERLLNEPFGRLEQEFLAIDVVHSYVPALGDINDTPDGDRLNLSVRVFAKEYCGLVPDHEGGIGVCKNEPNPG